MAPVLVWILVSVIPASEHWFASIMIGALGLSAYTVIAVRVHRYLLMEPGEAVTSKIGLYVTFGGLLVLGLLVLVLIGLITSQLAVLGAFISFPVAIGCMYVIARISLIFPDRAVGRSASFSTVWSWSQRNGWKLFAVLFLPLLVCQIPLVLLTFWMEPVPSNIANNILSVPITIFGVALLSQTYLELGCKDVGRGVDDPLREDEL